MSKSNTLHIIGFDVLQYTINVPAVVDVSEQYGVYVSGVFEEGVFE